MRKKIIFIFNSKVGYLRFQSTAKLDNYIKWMSAVLRSSKKDMAVSLLSHHRFTLRLQKSSIDSPYCENARVTCVHLLWEMACLYWPQHAQGTKVYKILGLVHVFLFAAKGAHYILRVHQLHSVHNVLLHESCKENVPGNDHIWTALRLTEPMHQF